MREFVEHHSYKNNNDNLNFSQENAVEIEQKNLRLLVEHICRGDQCRYPLLTLRLLIHLITGIDSNGLTYISARQLSKSMDVHYDTITKCLKYLRNIEAIAIKK